MDDAERLVQGAWESSVLAPSTHIQNPAVPSTSTSTAHAPNPAQATRRMSIRGRTRLFGARSIVEPSMPRLGEVAPENKLGKRLVSTELEEAIIALALQIGIGTSSPEDLSVAEPFSANGDDSPRIVTLPRDHTLLPPAEGAGHSVRLPAGHLTELAPRAFSKARAAFGLPGSVYRATLAHPHVSAGTPLWPTLSKVHSEGNAGIGFWVSSDSRLIIRRVTKGEAQALLAIASDYLQHVAAVPHTLLPRFFGLVKYRNMYYTVTENFYWSGIRIDRRASMPSNLFSLPLAPSENLGQASVLSYHRLRSQGLASHLLVHQRAHTQKECSPGP